MKQSDSFRQKRKMYPSVLTVTLLLPSMLFLAFLIPDKLIPFLDLNVEKVLDPLVLPLVSSGFNLDENGIEQIGYSSSDVATKIPNYMKYGSIAFAQTNSNKEIGSIIYTDGTVLVYSEKSEHVFEISASPMSVAWADKQLVIFSESFETKKEKLIHVFSYNSKKDIWKHTTKPHVLNINQYETAHFLHKRVFINTAEGVSLFFKGNVTQYLPQHRILKIIGNTDFFANHLVSFDNKSNFIRFHILDVGIFQLMFDNSHNLIPTLMSTDRVGEKYNVILSYGGKIYKVSIT